jgi:chemotaxis protein CheY-P-specific phosphatase CheC
MTRPITAADLAQALSEANSLRVDQFVPFVRQVFGEVGLELLEHALRLLIEVAEADARFALVTSLEERMCGIERARPIEECARRRES